MALLALAATSVFSACGGDALSSSPDPVESVTLEPSSLHVGVGSTSNPIVVTVKDAQGNVLRDRRVFWSSEDTSIAVVSQNGAVTGKKPGLTRVAASSENKPALAFVTVEPTSVASISLEPQDQEIHVGTSLLMQATTLDAAGSVLSGRAVAWSSSNTTVAVIDVTGRVTGLSAGDAIITATSEGRSATTTVHVTRVPVGTITVAPPSASLFVGQTTQLTATVRDASGGLLPDRAVTWSTNNPAAATVSLIGLVTGVAPGTAIITAASEGASTTIQVTVSPMPVGAVVISPSATSITVGQSTTFTAQVTDATGNVLTGRPITWTSETQSVATITASGVATGVAPGTATIRATSEGKTGTAVLVVTAVPVASVTVAPITSSIVVGTATQLGVTVKDTNGDVVLNRLVQWSSSNEAVAIVSSTGRVLGVSPGTVTITAASEGQSGTATVTVTRVPVGTVSVSTPPASLTPGQTTTLTATVRDINGNIVTDRAVGWTSSDETVATVSSDGVVTAVAPGTATITASAEGKSGTATVTVTAPPVAQVTVTPSDASVQVGLTVTLTATTRAANGDVLTGREVTWTTSDENLATVTQAGVVTGVAPGDVTITATSEGKSGTATVTVTAPAPAAVASVSVSEPGGALTVGQTTTLTATPKDADGNPLEGRFVSWSSNDETVATVDQSGLVTAIAPGTATITATSEGQSGSVTVTVEDAPTAAVAQVLVEPSSVELTVDQSRQLTAITYDASGGMLSGRVVRWSSDSDRVANVDANGVVRGRKAGKAEVIATSEGVSGTALVTVTR